MQRLLESAIKSNDFLAVIEVIYSNGLRVLFQLISLRSFRLELMESQISKTLQANPPCWKNLQPVVKSINVLSQNAGLATRKFHLERP